MSAEGGDTGGGGGESGGGGKGGGSGGVDFAPNAVDYTPAAPPDSGPGPSSSSSDIFNFAPTTSAGEQAGFQGSGALPSEITSGSSGGNPMGNNPWAAPTIDDFVGSNGFNLAGPGPVGGDSGPVGVHGGVFSSNDSSSVPLAQNSDAVGTSAPSAGPGTGAAAFAAPAGVSGTSDLTSLVSDPNKTSMPNSQSVFDSLNGAQAATVDQYADAHAADIPSASSAPATSAGSGGSGNMGGLPSLSTNNIGAAVAGAGLLNNLVNGKSGTPAMGALNSQANTANANSAELLARGKAQGDAYGTPALASGQDQTARGAALQQYVATGTLPQGYEDQIQQAAQAAKSTIISNYANRGLPTDPTKNSALAQELAQVDARLPAAREQLAQSLATTGNSIVASGNQTSATGNALTGNALISDGLQSSGISSTIYQTLANLENDQNKQRGAAIANFASALNGGNKGVNINLGTKAA
jgi:hypothetical protein